MAPQTTELTRAEWTVMTAVWDEQPCTAPTIYERLRRGTRWSYSTVRTVMDRLVHKGVLTTEKCGKLSVFRAAVSCRQAQRHELLYALKHAFNNALTPMVQCLIETRDLDEAELDEIERLIHAKRRKAKK